MNISRTNFLLTTDLDENFSLKHNKQSIPNTKTWILLSMLVHYCSKDPFAVRLMAIRPGNFDGHQFTNFETDDIWCWGIHSSGYLLKMCLISYYSSRSVSFCCS